MSEQKIDNSSFTINLECDNKEDLVDFMHQSGVTDFEIRPFIEKKDGKFVFANTVSETDWDVFAKKIDDQESPQANFSPSFEVKKNNKITKADKKLLVGTNNRYTNNNIPDILKHQKKSKYLNLTESYSVLENLVEQFSGYVRFIEDIPHKTIQGRVHKAVHISTDFDMGKPVLMLIGGLHAREWVPQDALIYLVSDILQAYNHGSNLELVYGKYKVSFAELEAILEKIDLVILPCANPDGRCYSQTVFPDQRKNMNDSETGVIADPGEKSPQVGVDLNRNYDIAWDYNKLYYNVDRIGASYNPLDNSYHGKRAESENETQNIIWLMDEFESTRWLLDCHSYQNKVLIPWGLEDNQYCDKGKNISNPKYNKERGRIDPDSSYKEYLDKNDYNYMKDMAGAIVKATNDVNEKALEAIEASGLFSLQYWPGVLPDYAYSRHLNDKNKSKIYSLTVETGRTDSHSDGKDGFHPKLDRALILKKEICAGIFGLLTMIKDDV